MDWGLLDPPAPRYQGMGPSVDVLPCRSMIIINTIYIFMIFIHIVVTQSY
jgi:hypothetical protein